MTINFTLTHCQQKVLEAWLDKQHSSQPVNEFTVAFTVTPKGIQAQAYSNHLNTLLKQHPDIAPDLEICDLQHIDKREINQHPIASLDNLKIWIDQLVESNYSYTFDYSSGQ